MRIMNNGQCFSVHLIDLDNSNTCAILHLVVEIRNKIMPSRVLDLVHEGVTEGVGPKQFKLTLRKL